MNDIIENLEKEANKFFRKTGFNFDTYTNKVVKIMLKDFAKDQIKILCDNCDNPELLER